MGGSPGPTFEVPHEACPGRCRSPVAHRVQLVTNAGRRCRSQNLAKPDRVGKHRRGPVPNRSPGDLERHALPLQPRLRRAGPHQSGDGFARAGHLVVAPRPGLRDRRLVLQLDRMGAAGRIQGPGRAARFLQSALLETEARDRVGRVAGRDHHRRPDPALPGSLRRRDSSLRSARGRRGHVERRA